jgi:hypothetical protein
VKEDPARLFLGASAMPKNSSCTPGLPKGVLFKPRSTYFDKFPIDPTSQHDISHTRKLKTEPPVWQEDKHENFDGTALKRAVYDGRVFVLLD